MKRIGIIKGCKTLLEKVWLYYTHYHLLVVVNVILVTMYVVNPIIETNRQYKYGRLPCDPIFTSLILNGKKYEDLQKFRIKLTTTGFTFEYLMIGSYYFSHHVAVGATCLFGLCFAYVTENIAVWVKGMVTGLSGLRTIKVECYKPYDAADMHEYVKMGLLMAVSVAVWDILVTWRYEKKYLNVPFSVDLSKYFGCVRKICPRIFKNPNAEQPAKSEDPAEMI